jgi:hypothetical protein
VSQQPGDLNLRMYQGATFRYVLTWLEDDVPKNLGEYTARMQVRESYNSPTTILDIDTDDDITLGGAAGTITIEVAAADTTDIKPGLYVYDLELVSGSTVTRLVEGSFLVSAEVTR